MIFANKKMAVIATDRSHLVNHFPTSVRPGRSTADGNGEDPAAVDEIVGQLVERRLVGVAKLAQPTAMAPMKAPAKQPKKPPRNRDRHPRDEQGPERPEERRQGSKSRTTIGSESPRAQVIQEKACSYDGERAQ